MKIAIFFFFIIFLLFGGCKQEMPQFQRKQVLSISVLDSLQIPSGFTSSKLRTIFKDKIMALGGLEGGWFFVDADNLLPIMQEPDSLKNFRKLLQKNENYYFSNPQRDEAGNFGMFFSKKANRRVLAQVDSLENIVKELDFFENREDFLGLSEEGNIIANNKEVWFICKFVNRIYKLDRNLSLLQKAKTIDNSNIFAPVIKDSSMYRFARPPKMLNNACFVDEKYLYVNSYIPDASLDIKQNKRQVIDLYNKEDLQYKGSIYVPQADKRGIISFIVMKKYLYVLTETYLYQYVIKSENQ